VPCADERAPRTQRRASGSADGRKLLANPDAQPRNAGPRVAVDCDAIVPVQAVAAPRRRVTRFVTQPLRNTLFYGDRWACMGVRSIGRSSLTVIIFIVLGRTRSVSGAASVNRRVARLRSPGRFFGELRRGLAIARSATADRFESYLRSQSSRHSLSTSMDWRRNRGRLRSRRRPASSGAPGPKLRLRGEADEEPPFQQLTATSSVNNFAD